MHIRVPGEPGNEANHAQQCESINAHTWGDWFRDYGIVSEPVFSRTRVWFQDQRAGEVRLPWMLPLLQRCVACTQLVMLHAYHHAYLWCIKIWDTCSLDATSCCKQCISACRGLLWRLISRGSLLPSNMVAVQPCKVRASGESNEVLREYLMNYKLDYTQKLQDLDNKIHKWLLSEQPYFGRDSNLYFGNSIAPN